jgi:hypothetical protein
MSVGSKRELLSRLTGSQIDAPNRCRAIQTHVQVRAIV